MSHRQTAFILLAATVFVCRMNEPGLKSAFSWFILSLHLLWGTNVTRAKVLEGAERSFYWQKTEMLVSENVILLSHLHTEFFTWLKGAAINIHPFFIFLSCSGSSGNYTLFSIIRQFSKPLSRTQNKMKHATAYNRLPSTTNLRSLEPIVQEKTSKNIIKKNGRCQKESWCVCRFLYINEKAL